MRTLPPHRIAAFTALLIAVLKPLSSAEEPVIFTTFNVQNYETDASPKHPAKSEASITALIQALSQIKPDLLGVSEMGSLNALKDLQHRLNSAGIPLPHSEWVNGPDPDRHLALLSKFPFAKKNDASLREYTLGTKPFAVRRGFLDVTVQVNPTYQLRLVGAHLKSKLPVPEDESVVRRHEAAKLREHLDDILDENPETNLLVYGDLNDTRESPPIRELVRFRGRNALFELPAADHLGDRWTHYWKTADTYARIDYLLASFALLPEIPEKRGWILRTDNWLEASDHRPVSVNILPVETQKKIRQKR
jgi:endonuclease/exonuclease/phosphatase family metal-dependent hydrolase